MTQHQENLLSFWDHVEDLRKTILRIFFVVVCGTFFCFFFHQPLIQYLTYPVAQAQNPVQQIKKIIIQKERLQNIGGTPVEIEAIPGKKMVIPPGGYADIESKVPKKDNENLVILGPLEGIKTALKVSFWGGIAGTSPIWLWLLAGFVAPALHDRERRCLFPFLILSVTFLFLGIAFAHKFTIPLANAYLFHFNEGIGLNLWSTKEYLEYVLLLFLAHGLAAEMGMSLLFFVYTGFLSVETLRGWRRPWILFAFVCGALLTPPDIPSQLSLAIPLIVFYEAAILLGKFLVLGKDKTLPVGTVVK